jgi:hypothetical protein
MINNIVSKFISKLEEYYTQHNIIRESATDASTDTTADLADQFGVVHAYTHPSNQKKCYCMMRKHQNGYNIVDLDEDGNLVVDIFAPKGDENAENISLTPDLINTVKNLAGGQAAGSTLNPFDNPEKAIKSAYGTLLNKLAKKVKDLSNKIK